MADPITIEVGLHAHVSGPQNGWPSNRAAVEAVHHALDRGTVIGLDQYTRGEENEELVITLTVRHDGKSALASKVSDIEASISAGVISPDDARSSVGLGPIPDYRNPDRMMDHAEDVRPVIIQHSRKGLTARCGGQLIGKVIGQDDRRVHIAVPHGLVKAVGPSS